MEMPLHLRELLQENENIEDSVQEYFEFVSSYSNLSVIRCQSKPILPPLLSTDERSKMREYRREAVRLEQKLFDARREKYSQLLLQVMDVMDRMKEKEEKVITEPPCEGILAMKTNGDNAARKAKYGDNNGDKKLSNTRPQLRQKQSYIPEKDMNGDTVSIVTANNYPNTPDTAVAESIISQISPLLSSTTNQTINNESSVDRKIIFISKSDDTLQSQNEEGVERDSTSDGDTTLTVANRNQDFVFGNSHENIQRVFHKADGQNTSMYSCAESSMAKTATEASATTGESASVSTSMGFRVVDDSLASTNLSMAYTDSSVASLQSTMASQLQPFKSAQRQLNMDTINNNLYKSYQRQANLPLTSTPTTGKPVQEMRTTGSPSGNKLTTGNPTTSWYVTGNQSTRRLAAGTSARVSSKPTSGKGQSRKEPKKVPDQKSTSDQDKALEKLEWMRQKLLQEKEKQLVALKQQELARLRKKSGRTPDLMHEDSDEEDKDLSGRRSRFTRTTSDVSTMAAIAERSFEGSVSERRYPTEAESGSDKENIQRYFSRDDSYDYHGDDSRYHGDVTRYHGDDARYHGDATRYHGDDARYHGDASRYHGDDARYHGDDARYHGDLVARHGNDHDDRDVKKDTYGNGHKVWDSYSHHALGPGLLERGVNGGNRGSRRASQLYVRQEFLNKLQMLTSEGGTGLAKFCVLTAHAKGFLTRRLLQADRVQSVVKTIKDTRDFLGDIAKEGSRSSQEKALQDRVQAQLDTARGKLHDIFFKITAKERMSYLEHARNLARERETRQHEKAGKTEKSRRLSSATVKAMQRRQDEQHGSTESKRPSSGVSSPLGKRKNWDIRYNFRKQRTGRPGTAPPTRQASSRKSLGNRPATAHETRTVSSNNTKNTRPATSGEQATRRPGRASREEKLPAKRANRVSIEKPHPQRPSRASQEDKAPPRRLERSLSEERIPRGVSEEAAPPRRPLRMSLGSRQQPNMSKQGSSAAEDARSSNENKPKNGPTTRKVSRSMAARFSKK